MSKGFTESQEPEDESVVHLERLQSEAVWMDHDKHNSSSSEDDAIHVLNLSTWSKEHRDEFEEATASMTHEEFDQILEATLLVARAMDYDREKLRDFAHAMEEPKRASTNLDREEGC